VSAWAIIWSIGSSITNASYAEFETAVRAQIQNIFLPKTETLFDFFVNPENLLSFISWETKLQEFEFPKGCEYHDIMVPTIDTLKYKFIFELMLENRKPILITGDSGVGKTSLAVPFLFTKRENNVITIFLNFSAKTKPKETQLAIEAKLNKKGKTLFGARPNETIAIFIDDINMPELEK
jgi:dynein heavy chain, axonemal